MSLEGISISLAISLAFAVSLSTMLVRETLIPTCMQQTLIQVAEVSSRDAQQTLMRELMLRTETPDPILQAFEDAPANYDTKMHSHPSSVRFTAIPDHTAKPLATEWPAKRDAAVTARVNGKRIGKLANTTSELVTPGSRQVEPAAHPDGTINTAYITRVGCGEDCVTALLNTRGSLSGAECELFEGTSA